MRERILPLLLVVAATAAYANSFEGAFLFDDIKHIVESDSIHHLQPVSEHLLHARRPLVNLSLAANYALGGLDTWGYHLFNLIVHLFAGLTLFGVIRRTLLNKRLANTYGKVSARLAFAVALIWLVHPLQTQSVTYVIQRGESMMGLFYLLTLYCVIRSADSRHARWWQAAAVACCAAGMGCKAVMVTAPLAVLAYDRVLLSGSLRASLRERRGLYAGLALTWSILVLCGIVQAVLNPSARFATVGFGNPLVTPPEYAATQPGVILHYLKLSVWPATLCLDYGWPVARSAIAIVGPGLIVAALLIATLWGLRRAPALGFVGLWFFLILAPTSSFVPIVDPLFEHRMYLPLAAVIVLVVVGAYRCSEWLTTYFSRRGRLPAIIRVAPLVVAAIALGHATFERNKTYRSELVMWEDVVAKRPANARGHNNLGRALADLGRYDEASESLHTALRIDPHQRDARSNLGMVFISQNRFDDAVTILREALRANPRDANAHRNLGVALWHLGQLEEAMTHFTSALDIRPHFPEARNNLGIVLHGLGRPDDAIREYRTAIRDQPDFAAAHYNLGVALAAVGNVDEAIESYRQAIRFDPNHAKAQAALDAALEMGRPDEAVAALREALRSDPRDVDTYMRLGAIYVRSGNLSEAEDTYRAALKIDPNNVGLWFNLGVVLVKSEMREEAAEAFRHAIEADPTYAPAHFNLGSMSAQLGRFDQAVRSFRETLRLQPDHAGARRALAAALAEQERSGEP